MANCSKSRPQNRKRRHAEADFPQDPPSRPSKKFKSTKEHHSASNFPPSFYDSLSKVWLTRRALRELDRRNQLECSVRAQAPALKPVRQLNRKNLQLFARHGGPELSDLRQYPEPIDINFAHTMSPRRTSHSSHSSRSSQNRQSKSAKLSSNSTSKTSIADTSKTSSSAYDKNFEQYIIDENVFPEGYEYPNGRRTPEPDNEDELKESLARSRPSLSSSCFTNEDFRRFKRDNARVYEGSVMGTVFPTIRGKHTEIPHEMNATFAGLESITQEVITTARPDFYDGANPRNIDKQVKDELGPFIIPTIHARAPAVPNFFLEAKRPSGNVDVAKRQATLNGALGARAMHQLQSYAAGKPVYDNNAYTITSTYHDGHLKMYTTHITSPAGSGEPPEYHMKQYRAFAMTDTPDTCRDGLRAFRNGRDWTEKKRNQFISAANERARSMHAEQPTFDRSNYSRGSRATYLAEESDTSADELVAASFPNRAEEPGTSEDELAAAYPIATSFSYYNEEPEASANEPVNTSFYSEEEPELSEDELATSFSQRVTASSSHNAKRHTCNSLSNIIEESETSIDELSMPTRTNPTLTKKRQSKRPEKTVSKAPRQSTAGRGRGSRK